jgi:hypothetical protein
MLSRRIKAAMRVLDIPFDIETRNLKIREFDASSEAAGMGFCSTTDGAGTGVR